MSICIIYSIYLIFDFFRVSRIKRIKLNRSPENLEFVGGTDKFTLREMTTLFSLALDLANKGHQVHYVNNSIEGAILSSKNQNLNVYNDKEEPQLVIEALMKEIKDRIRLYDNNNSLETLPEVYLIYDDANKNQSVLEPINKVLNEYKDDFKRLKIIFVFSSKTALAFS